MDRRLVVHRPLRIPGTIDFRHGGRRVPGNGPASGNRPPPPGTRPCRRPARGELGPKSSTAVDALPRPEETQDVSGDQKRPGRRRRSGTDWSGRRSPARTGGSQPERLSPCGRDSNCPPWTTWSPSSSPHCPISARHRTYSPINWSLGTRSGSTSAGRNLPTDKMGRLSRYKIRNSRVF